MKKLSIAMTVAMVSTSAYAQFSMGGNGGAMTPDSGGKGGISSMSAGNAGAMAGGSGGNAGAGGNGGAGGKGAGGNGGAGGSFDEWDLDRNSVLSFDEARLAGFTQAEFMKMDVDQNGKVTRQEFMVAQIMPGAK